MICIDTNVLIWGVKRRATDNRKHMIQRAIDFFHQCKSNGIKIAIPAHVIGEFLVGYEQPALAGSLGVLQKAFRIVPFDAKAAAIAAELRRNKDLLNGIVEEYEVRRQVLNADVCILATAIAEGASHLVAEDAHMRKLAQGKILVKSLEKGLFDSAA
jgi:predicted nucleic acid-binding protein